MIWLEEQLNINGIPEGSNVYIMGNLIDTVASISVVFDHHDKCHSVDIWSKPISTWGHEEIIEEDVRRKYAGKVARIRAKHERLDYSEWIDYFAGLAGLPPDQL